MVVRDLTENKVCLWCDVSDLNWWLSIFLDRVLYLWLGSVLVKRRSKPFFVKLTKLVAEESSSLAKVVDELGADSLMLLENSSDEIDLGPASDTLFNSTINLISRDAEFLHQAASLGILTEARPRHERLHEETDRESLFLSEG